MSVLPVVDMKEPEAPTIIAKACKESGFFYLENHGIPQELLLEVFEQSRAFFSLPLEDKMTVLADKNNRGYTPMHEEVLDPDNQARGDTKEGYYIFREIEEGSEEAMKPLRGANQWPDEALVPGWRKTMARYFDRMHALGIELMGLLATGLGLDPAFFAGFFSSSMSTLRLLHYSPEVSAPEKGILGTGAHADYGLMTLLATDEVPGLQVRLKEEWFDVQPRPGAFICNLGEMLQRWTNDGLKATVHRVVNKVGRERYSIPFFCEPDFETEVVCLPQFCSESNPAKYPPTSSGLFLMEKYHQTHQDFTAKQQEDRR